MGKECHNAIVHSRLQSDTCYRLDTTAIILNFRKKRATFGATSRPARSAILYWISLKLISIIEGDKMNFHAGLQSDMRNRFGFIAILSENGRFLATSRPYRSAILVWISMKLIGIIEGYNTNFHAKL